MVVVVLVAIVSPVLGIVVATVVVVALLAVWSVVLARSVLLVFDLAVHDHVLQHLLRRSHLCRCSVQRARAVVRSGGLSLHLNTTLKSCVLTTLLLIPETF